MSKFIYIIALHRITEGQSQCGFYTQGTLIFLTIALTESQRSNERDLKGIGYNTSLSGYGPKV